MPAIQDKSQNLGYVQQSYAVRLQALNALGKQRFVRHFELAVDLLQAPFIVSLDRDSWSWTAEEWRSSYVCRILSVMMEQAKIDFRAIREATHSNESLATVWTSLCDLDHLAKSVRDDDFRDLKPVAQLLILGVFLARWSDDAVDQRFLVDSVVDWGTTLPIPIDFRSGSLEEWSDQFRQNASCVSQGRDN